MSRQGSLAGTLSLEGRQTGLVGKFKRFFCCSARKVPATMFECPRQRCPHGNHKNFHFARPSSESMSAIAGSIRGEVKNIFLPTPEARIFFATPSPRQL
jgi:hypothetical protein